MEHVERNFCARRARQCRRDISGLEAGYYSGIGIAIIARFRADVVGRKGEPLKMKWNLL